MTENKLSKEDCVTLLQDKYRSLIAEGETRYPRRSDFDEKEVVAIKAFLGPWPRALEVADIKPPRSDDKLQQKIEKRIRAKRRRTQEKIRRAESGNAETECTPAISADAKK
ncbi:MAG: hypothetical protein E7385_02995 [Ruminococcaceae bacterium]|nr:hypothetical protein [Oscillospiraceae bacterium]